MAVEMSFGQRLRRARRALDLTQEKVAERVGVTRAAYSYWEMDRNQPQSGFIPILADVLQVPVDYLLGEPQDTNVSPVPGTSGEIYRVPVLERGYAACCGQGFDYADMVAESDDYLDMPTALIGAISPDMDKRPFIVRAEGNSMIQAGIIDGALLLINPAEQVYDGESALVRFGDNSALAVKLVFFRDNCAVRICSADGSDWERNFSREDIDAGLFAIIGKVVAIYTRPKRH